MDYTTPYALYIQRCRETSSDYTFLTSLQAFIDNVHDEHSSPNIKASHIGNSDYLAIENDCSYMTNLISYFGIGPVSKKNENKLGQNSCAALKALCWLAPTSITLMSAKSDQKNNTLKFQFADYLNALDTCKSYTDDSVNLSNYITTDESNAVLIDKIVETVKDRKLASDISVLKKRCTSYFLVIMEFSDRHSLYGKIDMNMDKSIKELCVMYSRFLSNRFSIIYETSNGKYNKIITNNNTDIVLGNPSLWIQVRVLSDDKDKLILNISVYIHGNNQEGSSTFILDDTTVKSSASIPTFKEIGQFHVKFGYVTMSEAIEQSLHFNFNGIITSWNNRRTAHSYWNYLWDKYYKDNLITARCEVFVEDNRRVYSLLGCGNLQYAHPLVKRFLDMLMINMANNTNDKKPTISKELFSLLQTSL